MERHTRICEEHNRDLNGTVQCIICFQLPEVHPPYVYTVREMTGITVGRMLGFACKICYDKQKEEERKRRKK